MDNPIKKGAVEKALNQRDGILESASLVRRDRFGNEILVVYAVPAVLTLANASSLTLDYPVAEHGGQDRAVADASDLTNIHAQNRVQIALVNAIPRDSAGRVDEAKLATVPLLDSSVISSWSEQLRRIPQLEKVAVFSVLNHRDNADLHRDEVFRDFAWAAPGEEAENDDPVSLDSVRDATPDLAQPVRRAQVTGADQNLGDRLDGKYELKLADALYRAVETSPEKGIKYIDHAGDTAFQTYPELLELSNRVLAGLQASGIDAGDRILFQCVDNREFLAVFWACMIGGMVPVPMTIVPEFRQGNAVLQKLVNSWKTFENPVIVASNSLSEEFELVAGASAEFSPRVLFFGDLSGADTSVSASPATDITPDTLALMLLTSGSTGTPKAVMHTHRTLLNRCAATSSMNRFGREDVSLNWMPLDHVGGIVMFHLRDVYNACSQVQVATSWILEEPLRWLDVIDAEHASVTWAPNFAFALVNQRAQEIAVQTRDLSSMRFILNGGEAVVAKTARRFLALLEKDGLPRDSMKPTWGMSETASGVCFSHSFTLDSSADSTSVVEVGKPIPGTSIRIVGEQGRVLNEGEKGNLQIQGVTVTPGYYKNPQANQKAFTEDGWFDTGDVGLIHNGCLTITARTKDEIVINGVNHIADEIETIVELIPGVVVSFTAACAVRSDTSDTDALAIFFNPADDDDDALAILLQNIQQTVSRDAGILTEFIIPLASSQVPKTNIGKIQRSLLKKSFEQGEFDEIVRRSQRLLGTNTIPGWFFRKSWFPKALSAVETAPHTARRYLVFCDAAGLSEALCERLASLGQYIVRVSAADAFEVLSNNHYAINPHSATDYVALMQELQRQDAVADVILHCGTYAGVEPVTRREDLVDAQQASVFSLLQLLQALSLVNIARKSTELYVISNQLQQFSDDGLQLNPNATLLGLLKTAPLELDWLMTKHIDLILASDGDEIVQQADLLLRELECRNPDDEVVYRHGKRFTWQLSAEDFAPSNSSACPLKRGGIVLITGGLGGVGACVAEFLGRHFDCRLVLVGRSQLPARDQWAGILRQGGDQAERIGRFLDIEKTGAELSYRAVDITDTGQLAEVIQSAEKRWNDELNGIFHLAVGGDIGARWEEGGAHDIAAESIDSYNAMFSTKVYASWQLAELVSQRKHSFMVSFGSVIGVFGAARCASYAAAHTFLSQLTGYYGRKMPGRFYQFDWSVWDGLGLSQHDPGFAADFYRSLGYLQIPAALGMDSLMAGLSHSTAELIIGLDADKWPIRKHLPFEPPLLQKIVACFTASEARIDVNRLLNDSGLQAGVSDRFGLPVLCEFHQLPDLPEISAGIPDIAGLQALIEHQISADNDKPQTELEQKIATFWCEILQVSNPGRNVSFFQLGGNSLNATQLISRLKRTFNIELLLRDLFNFATIAEMAAFVENNQTDAALRDVEIIDDVEADRFNSRNAHALLENIDQMSEAEVSEWLKAMQQEGAAK